jgi:hypothetical protein
VNYEPAVTGVLRLAGYANQLQRYYLPGNVVQLQCGFYEEPLIDGMAEGAANG